MKIKLDLQKCIGCGTCSALCEQCFELGSDSKAHIKGGQNTGLIEEKEIQDLGCCEEGAEACPVQAIEIEK